VFPGLHTVISTTYGFSWCIALVPLKVQICHVSGDQVVPLVTMLWRALRCGGQVLYAIITVHLAKTLIGSTNSWLYLAPLYAGSTV
jgi:hypothetical protein